MSHEQKHLTLPQPVVDLLAAAFPEQTIGDFAPTFGGFSNLSVAATIGGRRCVAKIATAALKRADLRREAQMLELLGDSGLPIPPLFALVEDDSWTVEVIGFVVGTPGLHALARPAAELEPIYHALGRLLARVHRTPLEPVEPELLISTRARQLAHTLPALSLDADLHEIVAASLAHPVWRPPAVCLVHSDAGIHNILWDGRIAALLDWEWAGWGLPLIDLAWLWWTLRWRNLPDRLWQTFLTGYGPGPALISSSSPEAMRALVLGQIAQILTRAQGQPEAWQEWLRRLRWSLSLAFPSVGTVT